MLPPLVSSKVGEVEKETIGTMTGEKIFQFTDVMCSLSLQDGFHCACFVHYDLFMAHGHAP